MAVPHCTDRVRFPEHVPTFASYCPEAALEEFDQCQRREVQFALRRIRERATAEGRDMQILSSVLRADAPVWAVAAPVDHEH